MTKIAKRIVKCAKCGFESEQIASKRVQAIKAISEESKTQQSSMGKR